MMFGKNGTSFVLISVLLLGAACAEPTSQRQALPRSFGPVTLGMTEEQFEKITGVTKEDFCSNCADQESMLSVDVDKFPGAYPAYLYKLPKYARGITAVFYEGKLYSVEMTPEFSELETAKNRYGEMFGRPDISDWKNGLSFARWEDETTAVVLTYVRQQDNTQGYPLTMPAGTVSSIEYIDKLIRADLEAHEKKQSARESNYQMSEPGSR